MLSPYEYDFLFCLTLNVLLAQLHDGAFVKTNGRKHKSHLSVIRGTVLFDLLLYNLGLC